MTYKVLAQEQVEFFLERGYVVLHDCFTQEQADWVLQDIWPRLNMDPNDDSTWHVSRVLSREEHGDSVKQRLESNTLNMPKQRFFSLKEFLQRPGTRCVTSFAGKSASASRVRCGRTT